jgi:hypothetical protein
MGFLPSGPALSQATYVVRPTLTLFNVTSSLSLSLSLSQLFVLLRR